MNYHPESRTLEERGFVHQVPCLKFMHEEAGVDLLLDHNAISSLTSLQRMPKAFYTTILPDTWNLSESSYT